MEKEVVLLISNNCSTDGTYELLENFKEKYCDIIELYHQPKNLGMGGNFEFVLQTCKSEYIQICSDDDLYEENMVLTTINILKNKKPDYIFLNAVYRDNSTVMLEQDYEGSLGEALKKILGYTPHISPTVIKSNLIKDVSYMHSEWMEWEKLIQLDKNNSAYITSKPHVKVGIAQNEVHWLDNKKIKNKYHTDLMQFCIVERDKIVANDVCEFFLKECIIDTELVKYTKLKKYKKRLQIFYYLIPVLCSLILIETLIFIMKLSQII